MSKLHTYNTIDISNMSDTESYTSSYIEHLDDLIFKLHNTVYKIKERKHTIIRITLLLEI